jgi:hypothetical protein
MKHSNNIMYISYNINTILVLNIEYELLYFLVSTLNIYNIKAIKLYLVDGCVLLKTIEV